MQFIPMDVRSKTLCSEKVTTDKVSWQNGSVAYTNIYSNARHHPVHPHTKTGCLSGRSPPSMQAGHWEITSVLRARWGEAKRVSAWSTWNLDHFLSVWFSFCISIESSPFSVPTLNPNQNLIGGRLSDSTPVLPGVDPSRVISVYKRRGGTSSSKFSPLLSVHKAAG